MSIQLEDVHEEIKKVVRENTGPLITTLNEYKYPRMATLYSISMLIRNLEEDDPEFYRNMVIPELAAEVNYAIKAHSETESE